ncbi:MAG: hypothetical protein R3C16_05845 [Hyphomonadaceae bacterium]
MAALPPIAPVAPAPPPAQPDSHASRAPVQFGAAVTHQDLVREKLRVDPAALADKKRAGENVRSRDPPRERSDGKGRYFDISV